VAAPLGHGRARPGHPDNRALCHPDRDRRDKPGDDATSFAPVTNFLIFDPTHLGDFRKSNGESQQSRIPHDPENQFAWIGAGIKTTIDFGPRANKSNGFEPKGRLSLCQTFLAGLDL